MLIVALGDSLTAGFPLEPYSWTVRLLELPATVINAGINGDTLTGMLRRLDRDVIAREPDLCFFMGGSNDAFHEGLEAMQTACLAIADRLRRAGVPQVVGVPPPTLFAELEERLEPFRAWLKKNLENPLDFREAFSENGEIRRADLPDGVHPSRAAYERMGQLALTFFRTLGR